jgi:hypothetical protein
VLVVSASNGQGDVLGYGGGRSRDIVVRSVSASGVVVRVSMVSELLGDGPDVADRVGALGRGRRVGREYGPEREGVVVGVVLQDTASQSLRSTIGCRNADTYTTGVAIFDDAPKARKTIMPGRRITWLGLSIAGIALVMVGTGCIPVGPPAPNPPAASLQITPSPAKFPTTPPPYWPMPIVPVTVTNTGHAAVGSIVVHPVGVYSVPSNNCTTLAPGQHCVANVQFCPTSPNHYLNTLLVTGRNAVTGSSVQAKVTLDGTAT